jgi:hypothetical protein
MTPDFITKKTLVLIKQIYQRAVVQSALQHSDVDKILSLISFDLAIETVLKLAIMAVSPRTQLPPNLGDLIAIADRVFENASPCLPSVPDAQKIKRVRKYRNDAMHDAKHPTADALGDCRTYTRDFLQRFVSNVWSEDFSSISLTQLVRNPRIKDFLSRAEIDLENGSYQAAAIQAKAGFDAALGKIQSAIVGSDMFSSNVGNEIVEAISAINNILILPVIGLDYPSYIQYRHLTGHIGILYFTDGELDISTTGPERSPDETTFIVNYAINSVIQIESFVGDIDKPFGYDAPFW